MSSRYCKMIGIFIFCFILLFGACASAPQTDPSQTVTPETTEQNAADVCFKLENVSFSNAAFQGLVSQSEGRGFRWLNSADGNVLFSVDTYEYRVGDQGPPQTEAVYLFNTLTGDLKTLALYNQPAYIDHAVLTDSGFAAAVTRDYGSSYEIVRYAGENETVIDHIRVEGISGENAPALCAAAGDAIAVTYGLSADGTYGFRVFGGDRACIKEFTVPHYDNVDFNAAPDYFVPAGDAGFYYVFTGPEETLFYYVDSLLNVRQIENTEGFTHLLGVTDEYAVFCKTAYFANGTPEKQSLYAVKQGAPTLQCDVPVDCRFYNVLFSDAKAIYTLNENRRVCVIGINAAETLCCEKSEILIPVKGEAFSFGNGGVLKVSYDDKSCRLYQVVLQ